MYATSTSLLLAEKFANGVLQMLMYVDVIKTSTSS